MSELANQLIEEHMRIEAKTLDLGKRGLSKILVQDSSTAQFSAVP